MSDVKKWYIGAFGGEAQARPCSPAEFEIIHASEGRLFVLAENYDSAVQCFLTAAERCVAAERREKELQQHLTAADEQIDLLSPRHTEQPEGKRERFEKWVMATKHPVYGFLDGRSLARGDDRTGYADEYVQGLWVAYLAFGVEQFAPVSVVPILEDRETLIGYGRSSGLDEASTLCARLAYAAYYPPGTRFKAFTPKAQKALGDLLIKAANEIASLPGGPYERFKARQAKTAESAKSR
ncbi:hypothetical protein [Pseudomonas sp. 14P_5.3_Bac1]|uniref:hypothetical protein n=1 Tax=Pseudomonas sp. 14P_5.3_Bac1 TaxID=2971622 RepID=UPI0021C6E5C9|nr:hypothetical protein [Pseudomonas sp. 14P_5.3_Bac1]MCU1776182.1 hypothetical protein [Pseudomonas sp. 14P_5.3_Bac1]